MNGNDYLDIIKARIEEHAENDEDKMMCLVGVVYEISRIANKMDDIELAIVLGHVAAMKLNGRLSEYISDNYTKIHLDIDDARGNVG